jgi:SAM-dependent methyltransferase
LRSGNAQQRGKGAGVMRRASLLIRTVANRLGRSRAFSALVLTNPRIDGKHIALDPAPKGHALLLAPHSTAIMGRDGLPVPPQQFWEGYGRTTTEYLDSGRHDVDTMLRLLRAAGADLADLCRVLDFGCASGRMLRAFPRGSEHEVWGVDINASPIAWCTDHLSPPFRFATTTMLPHLPFEDASFDLIWCGSVFTHISDLATSWLLELRRIVRPGGWLYITIQTKHSLEDLEGRFFDDPVNGPFAREMTAKPATHDFRSNSSAHTLILGADPVSHVFYDADHIVRRWSALADVVSFTEEAHDYQAAIVLRKRQSGTSSP